MTVPLAEGHELLGVFELTHPAWTDELLGFLGRSCASWPWS